MNRLPGLDLLRSIAIIWVMLFHALGAGLGAPSQFISFNGWMGVDLFFVLSGFLIGSQLLKSISKGCELNFSRFYISRAFRILPAYLVVLAVYIFVPSFRESEAMQPGWQFITFTVNIFIDSFHSKAFSHVWSLCIEEHFYLVFPVIVGLLMGRCTTAKVVFIAILVVVAGMVLRGFIWTNELAPIHHIASGAGNFGQLYIEKIYYPTYTRLDGLLAGILLAILKTFKPDRWNVAMKYANTLLVIGLAGMWLATCICKVRFGLPAAVIGFPLLSFSLAFIVAAATSSNSIMGKVKMPGARMIAALAFSLYLTHKAVFHVVETYFGEVLAENGTLAFLAYGLSAFAIALVLYELVERPFLRLRERFLAKSNNAGEVTFTT